jgi:hypothetical protein
MDAVARDRAFRDREVVDEAIVRIADFVGVVEGRGIDAGRAEQLDGDVLVPALLDDCRERVNGRPVSGAPRFVASDVASTLAIGPPAVATLAVSPVRRSHPLEGGDAAEALADHSQYTIVHLLSLHAHFAQPPVLPAGHC